jgi:ABC-type transport system substrate-binding protein
MKKRIYTLLSSLILMLVVSIAVNAPSVVLAVNDPSGPGGDGDGTASVQPPPTQEDFDTFNPLKIFNTGESETYYANPDELDTPAGIINRVLQFAFPLAGLILFVMLLWGGFEMLAGAATKKSLDAGRQRITAAVVGFLLLFASYWIAQILEAVLGVSIL